MWGEDFIEWKHVGGVARDHVGGVPCLPYYYHCFIVMMSLPWRGKLYACRLYIDWKWGWQQGRPGVESPPWFCLTGLLLHPFVWEAPYAP